MLRRRKAKAKKKVKPLELDVIRNMANGVPEQARRMIWLDFFTGLRPPGILVVAWDKIDINRKIIKVEQQISRDPDSDIEVYVKTSSSNSVGPISIELEKLIRQHVTRFSLGPKSLLFKNRDGGLLRYKHASRDITLAPRPLGVLAGEGTYVLHHICVAVLIRRGASIKAIQVLLGQKEVLETLGTYGHRFPEDLSNLVSNLDSLYFGRDSTNRHQIA